MRITLTALLLGIVACSHSQPAPQSPPSAEPVAGAPGGSGAVASEGPEVDPTLPSWAPRSCKGYHAAVVNALVCEEIAQGTRDLIKKTYEDRNHGWQAVEDAPQGRIAEIGKQCTDDAALVRAEHAGKCGMTAAR